MKFRIAPQSKKMNCPSSLVAVYNYIDEIVCNIFWLESSFYSHIKEEKVTNGQWVNCVIYFRTPLSHSDFLSLKCLINSDVTTLPFNKMFPCTKWRNLVSLFTRFEEYYIPRLFKIHSDTILEVSVVVFINAVVKRIILWCVAYYQIVRNFCRGAEHTW